MIYKIEEKHVKALGHLGLINDNLNSEMNNNQNNIKIKFLILLFQVNFFFLNLHQTSNSQPRKQIPAHSQQKKHFLVSLLLNLDTILLDLIK